MSDTAHAPAAVGRETSRALQALVFDGLPFFIEEHKARQPATRVFGADVYADEVVRAFVRYGNAERYVFFRRDFDETLRGTAVQSLTARTWIASPGNIHDLASLEQTVLLSFRPLPQNFVALRQHLQVAWPIVSVIHAAASVNIPTLAQHLLTRDLGGQDAVVCSTDAGRRALLAVLERAAAACLYNVDHEPPPAVRFPRIPIGIDASAMAGDRLEARRALGLDPETTILLCLGRLTPHAKADLGPLLHGYRELSRRVTRPTLLIIAGDDTRHGMAERLRQYASALDGQPQVQVWPDVSRETKRQLYNAADIFVAPSDHIQETFGIALVEALCVGLPIVASDWSGFREVVDEGVTGFLVPTTWLDVDGALELVATPLTVETRNSILAGMTVVDIDALVERLFQLVENPALRHRMGEAARRVGAERYDWSRVIPQYEALFVDLLHHARRPASPRSRTDVQATFAHYPSSAITGETHVVLSPRGRNWLASPVALSTLADDYAFDAADIAARLQTLVDEINARPIQAVVDALAPKYGRLAASWLVSRLLKYGLLRIVSP